MIRLLPNLEPLVVDPPSGMPCLHCIFFVEDKDDPTKTECVGLMPGMRQVSNGFTLVWRKTTFVQLLGKPSRSS